MRILFYLPVVTPWWFQGIILDLVEKLALDNEVHIMMPLFWQGTGLRQEEYDAFSHLPQIKWHIVTDKDHPSMRSDAVQREQIVEFVQALTPDIVICRSADLETIAHFPGIVRHVMEGVTDPLRLPAGVIQFPAEPFDHGLLPELSKEQTAHLDALIEPYWQSLLGARERQESAQVAFRQWADLPSERPTLFLPLEYEHEENFFTAHRVGQTPNAKLVEDVIERLDGRALLALTNHPLNDLHVDNSALLRLVERFPEHVRLVPGKTTSGHSSTPYLMHAADGVLLGDSKCFSLSGFCATPMLRRSRFKSGDWLNAYDDFESFVTDVVHGKAKRPDKQSARTWFVYQAANNLVWSKDPQLTGARLIERLVKPFAPERWDAHFTVFASGWPRLEEVPA